MTQTIFNQATVALAMTSEDGEVVQYAAMLNELGICQRFHFIHVVTPPHERDDQTAESIRQRMESIVSECFPGEKAPNDLSFQVRFGVRIDNLIDAAAHAHSDLIVLGHRRLRSGRRSLARRLAMLGPMAVWMVPEGSANHISKILAPTDFSEHAAESLAVAVNIARHAGLSCCRALHVAFDASTIRYDEHIAEWAGNEQRSMSEFLKRADTQGIDIHPMFRESINVGQAIVRAAQDINADLLVMSTRGRSRAAAILLGSATSQTMTDCHIPILVIKNHGSHMTVFEALRESRFWRQPDIKTN